MWICPCGYENKHASHVCRRCRISSTPKGEKGQGYATLPDINRSSAQQEVPSGERHFVAASGEYDPKGTDGTWDRPASKRVIAISNGLTDDLTLERAVHRAVGMVIYDAKTCTLSSLLQRIQKSAGSGGATSIALIDHGTPGEFKLLANLDVTCPSLQENQELRHFFIGLGKLIVPGGRLDLLACDLVSSKEGLKLCAKLEELTGCPVAASNNKTAVMVDFKLEKGNVDAAQEYFDISRLQQWTGSACPCMPFRPQAGGQYDRW